MIMNKGLDNLIAIGIFAILDHYASARHRSNMRGAWGAIVSKKADGGDWSKLGDYVSHSTIYCTVFRPPGNAYYEYGKAQDFVNCMIHTRLTAEDPELIQLTHRVLHCDAKNSFARTMQYRSMILRHL